MLRCGKVVGGDSQVEIVAFSRPPWRKNATPLVRAKSFRDRSTPAGPGHVRRPAMRPRARLLHHARLCQAKVSVGLT